MDSEYKYLKVVHIPILNKKVIEEILNSSENITIYWNGEYLLVDGDFKIDREYKILGTWQFNIYKINLIGYRKINRNGKYEKYIVR